MPAIRGDVVVIPAAAADWTLAKASGIASRSPLPKFARLAEAHFLIIEI